MNEACAEDQLLLPDEIIPVHPVPADHKWYRDIVIADSLLEALREMDPKYPKAEAPQSALQRGA